MRALFCLSTSASCLALVLGLATISLSQPSDYVIGPDDVLAVTVHGQSELSGRYEVGEDGTIVFPLVGRVRAEGTSAQALRDDLRRRLAEGYLKDPQVSVSVDRHASQQVMVIGEVRQPGTYALSGRLTVLEALTRAGFTTGEAAAEVVVIRAGTAAPGEDASPPAGAERLDLRRLQNGTLPETVLRDGDTVLVPKAAKVFVFGHVRTPGAYVYQPGMTVLELLALAGGITERGSDHRLRVVRTAGDTRRELRVRLHDVVQPGDTLKVPERFF
jgi:polysaccharide biosynthesis/export protein